MLGPGNSGVASPPSCRIQTTNRPPPILSVAQAGYGCRHTCLLRKARRQKAVPSRVPVPHPACSLGSHGSSSHHTAAGDGRQAAGGRCTLSLRHTKLQQTLRNNPHATGQHPLLCLRHGIGATEARRSSGRGRNKGIRGGVQQRHATWPPESTQQAKCVTGASNCWL